MICNSRGVRLEDLLRSLELKTLDVGVKLHRGSFEGRPNECWKEPYLFGLKYFTCDMSYALTYAQRTNHPSCIVHPKDARGVIYCLEITEPCKVLEFPDDGGQFVKEYTSCLEYMEYLKRVQNSEKNFLQFERLCLMPIMRKICGDDISGYIESDGKEALLELGSISYRLSANLVVEVEA